MAIAKRIMGGGVSAGTAKAITGGSDTSTAVSAAGTSASDATAIHAGIIAITTCASGAGVIIDSDEIGDEYEIINLGASACTIYPPTGEQVNALTASQGFLLATNTAVKLKKFTATRWAGFLSA